MHTTAPGALHFSVCLKPSRNTAVNTSAPAPLCCSRDVSSAGLVIANHQDIKSEIETRADSFTACIEMGNALLNNNHYASDEVQRVDVIYTTVG